MDSILAIFVPMIVLATVLGRRCLQLEAELDAAEAALATRDQDLEALLAVTPPTYFTEEHN